MHLATHLDCQAKTLQLQHQLEDSSQLEFETEILFLTKSLSFRLS